VVRGDTKGALAKWLSSAIF